MITRRWFCARVWSAPLTLLGTSSVMAALSEKLLGSTMLAGEILRMGATDLFGGEGWGESGGGGGS